MQKGFLVLAVASCMTFSAAYAQNDQRKEDESLYGGGCPS